MDNSAEFCHLFVQLWSTSTLVALDVAIQELVEVGILGPWRRAMGFLHAVPQVIGIAKLVFIHGLTTGFVVDIAIADKVYKAAYHWAGTTLQSFNMLLSRLGTSEYVSRHRP